MDMYDNQLFANAPLNMRQSSPSVRMFNTDPSGGGGATTTYHLRAWDSGLVQYVTWTSADTPDLSPASGDTTPNYTGTLSGHHISYTT